MATENPWRAPRIQAELEKLGIRFGLATVSRYLPEPEPEPEPDRDQRQRWIGTVRRERLDHVVVINEEYPRPLLLEYVEDDNGERVPP